MKAAASVAAALKGVAFARVGCDLLGSLAWTGEGHATDKAVILGLDGFLPDGIEPELIDSLVDQVRAHHRLRVADRDIAFNPKEDLRFDRLGGRSEEHTSEVQSPMRNSYAAFCLPKKTK